MEAEDAAVAAMRSPPDQIPRAAAHSVAEIAAAIRVDERLEVIQTSIDHALQTRLQVDVISGPPHRVSVLGGALGVALRVHPRPPVGFRKLGEDHRPSPPAVLRARPIDVLHGREEEMRSPRGVVKALPEATVAAADHRRWD